MKRVILLTALLLIGVAGMAQRWQGFFEPKNGVEITTEREGVNQWFFRPAAQLTALQFTWDKTEEVFKSSGLSSAGIGLGYQHYTQKDGELINNYGVNALIIFDGSQNSQGGVGVAATVNALQFVNLGGGYNFTNKQFFLLTGAVWTF